MVIAFLFIYQLLFSCADVIARKHMRIHRLDFWHCIFRPWILGFIGIRLVGIFLRFYVIYLMFVGRVAIYSSCLALLFSALGGSVYLREKIRPQQLLAVVLIVAAILIQGTR